MKLIDAHSHINFNGYKDDAEEVIGRARAAGIGMLAVGSQHSTSERAVEYAEKHEDIWAVVGLHPTHLFPQHIDEEEISYDTRQEVFDADFYRKLAQSSKRVVGIGECGLDYYRLPENVPAEEVKKKQQEVFRQHLDLCLELDLPVMVHVRDAHADTIAVFEDYAAQGKKPRGNIHCFTGTVEDAERYLALGLYISFTGIITFPPSKLQKALGHTLQDVVKAVPLEKMLVETDAPYLAPVPFRGKRNEPAYVQYVAGEVAKIRNITLEEVEAQTLMNTKALFRLS